MEEPLLFTLCCTATLLLTIDKYNGVYIYNNFTFMRRNMGRSCGGGNASFSLFPIENERERERLNLEKLILFKNM